MYIHAGAGRIIRGQDIIGVFDMDGHTDSEINRDFLKKAEKRGDNASAGDDLPRCFIVTDRGVIFTHISVSAVTKRLK